ncbi:hypothetical protein SUGI_0153250 [Cryptomeria japonica]|nr:hypothetical protein SUGI_0153250 [Cryptomeria japonica]
MVSSRLIWNSSGVLCLSWLQDKKCSMFYTPAFHMALISKKRCKISCYPICSSVQISILLTASYLFNNFREGFDNYDPLVLWISSVDIWNYNTCLEFNWTLFMHLH